MTTPTNPVRPSQPTSQPDPSPSPFVWDSAGVTADLLSIERARAAQASPGTTSMAPQWPELAAATAKPLDLAQDLQRDSLAGDMDHAVQLARHYLDTQEGVVQKLQTLPLVEGDLGHLRAELDTVQALLERRQRRNES
ncbi:hypothetical protein IWQ60_007566 [Tieghemiomyces parasiticus]|uniref:Uncharacterized protein n=1 Tax=Tieghemiomyces parasiticus TaxID=78921 RepID=A0A9W8DUB9_9FUNG|nr:hypothetical protein IWQ60_007566 [Tieghemiomyces parasiticus]